MKKIISGLSLAAVALLPALAFAQNIAQNNSQFSTDSLNNLLSGFEGLVNVALLVLSGVAVLVFIYGIIRFVLGTGDPEKRKEAKYYMIYGVVAFAIIAGLYGLSNALLGFFGVSSGGNLTIPQIDTSN